MKRLWLALLLFVSSVAVYADIKITKPLPDEVVTQIKEASRAFLQLSREERKAYFYDKEKAAQIRADQGDVPLPVEIAWADSAPRQGKTYKVTVQRVPDGKVFCRLETTELQAQVFNLEIARSYEVTVSAEDGTAKLAFRTEDQAPRLLKFETIRNARDFGGRIGLDGRRIKQSRIFRTSGLNKNAVIVYYKKDEVMKLHEEGKLKDMGDKGASLERQIQRTGTVDPKFIRLIKSTPDKPGEPKLKPEEVQRILDTYGIKADIDLRSDMECYGMKGSPLGDTVKWYQYTYSNFGYGYIFSDTGRQSMRTVFTLLLDESNYPCIFHCIGGADRTGVLSFVLNALLGVEEDELYKDYECTGFSGSGIMDDRHRKWFEGLVSRMSKMEGSSMREKAEKFAESCGISMEEIQRFREMMLE